MNYQLDFSTTLLTKLFAAAGSSLKNAIDNCFFNLYSGAIPTVAQLNTGITFTNLVAQLCKSNATITNNMTWDDTTSPGTLQKPAADTWSTPTGSGILVTDTPTFFVINTDPADNNSAAPTSAQFRILGLIGPDDSYALKLGMLTAGQPLALNSFSIFVNQ